MNPTRLQLYEAAKKAGYTPSSSEFVTFCREYIDRRFPHNSPEKRAQFVKYFTTELKERWVKKVKRNEQLLLTRFKDFLAVEIRIVEGI